MSHPPKEGSQHSSRTRSAFQFPRLTTVLLLAALLIGFVIRLQNFSPEISRTPDERTYTRQANIVLTMGTPGFRFLGQELENDMPAVALYPSPLRIGYISLLVRFMRLTGNSSVLAGAQLSLLCSLACLLVIAFTAYCFLSPTAAIVATLFFAVYPFDLVVSGRTWQEALINLLATLFLTLGALIARTQSLRRYICLGAFTVLGVLALATKENLGIAFLLCAFGLVVYFLFRHDREAAILTASSAAVSVLTYVLILGALFGGVIHALYLVRTYAHYSGLNPYSAQYESGPVWMFPAGLFRISPFVFVAAVGGFGLVLFRAFHARRPADAGLPLGIALMTAGILLVQIVSQRFNFRLTAPAFGSMCMLAGIGADAALTALHRLLAPLGNVVAWGVLGFAVSIAALRDFNFAQDNLILPQVPDLPLRNVLSVPPASVPPGNSR
jgi:hypothetical protein